MFTYQPGPYTAPLGIYDLFFGILLLLIIMVVSSSKQTKMLALPGNEHYRYYMLNIWFKLFFALAYGAIYMFYYKGGDTMAYWQGAEKLNNLMWHSPTTYWKEMISKPAAENIILRFNPDTGYPPVWIYRDPGSFFVSKIISLFMIFCGQSYVVLTLFMGYLTAISSWKIFELVRKYKITTDAYAAISLLFIPSVAFWCAGVSKDTIVLIAVFYFLHHFFGIANGTVRNKWRSILLVFVFVWVLFNTRTFMLITVLVPIAVAISTRFVKQYSGSVVLSNMLRLLIISTAGLGFLFFLRWQGEEFAKAANQYLTEAQVQQADFANNESYGEKRYDLGITDYSPMGMISVAPQAIFTAFYRPGIWEARSPLLFISGLETTVFIYLTLLFLFKGKLIPKIKTIRQNEFLVFAVIFALILGYFAGFTSGLFGVLVRFKAPLLPFLLIVLTTNPVLINKQAEVKEIQ